MGRNVTVKNVAERLRHSQTPTTVDLYSRVTPTMQRTAAGTLDAVLRR